MAKSKGPGAKGTANKGTVIDQAVEEVDVAPERLNGLSIDAHLIALGFHESFYCDIIRSLTKIETTEIPTAGVVQKDSELMLWWNRKFVAGLTDLQIRGLLKHEALHLILLHTTSRRHEPHWVWNWAADLAINSMIPEVELPECGLIPGKAFSPLTAKALSEMTPDQVARFDHLSKLIASFPKNEAGEWYFGKLMDDPKIKEMEKERQDNEAAFKEAMRRLGEQMGGEGDSHEGWGEGEGMDEEQRQLIEGKVRQILKEAQQKADKSNSWGSTPLEIQTYIRKLVSGEIPWQSVLRQFVGFTRRQDRSETWARSSKKDPWGAPGTTYSYRPNLFCFVDQSGSVPDSSLELFFGELASLSRKATFTIFYFDTEVDVKNSFEWRQGTAVTPNRTRCGGTDFEAPTKYANADKRCDGYIILTDGGAPKPSPSKKRRAWVLDPGNKLYFDADRDTKDVLIQMTGKAS